MTATRVNGPDVSSRLNPHLLSLMEIPDELQLVIVDPSELLLHPQRFDIMPKFIYAKHREMGVGSSWAAGLYKEHIRAFNNFSEGDSSGKAGETAFFDSFHEILASIKTSGFDQRRSLVPISRNGAVIDGSHRVAACALYQQPVACVVLDADPCYDFRFFVNRGLDQKWCDAIAHQHCHLNSNVYLVIVYPSADRQDPQLDQILERSGTVIYRKDIDFSHRGSVNLIRHVYSDEPWLGSLENRFAGAQEKARQCFLRQRPARIFAYEIDGTDQVRRVKEEIRDLFGIGNHSVHINDTHQEKSKLAGLFFNDNSIHFLNHERPGPFDNYTTLLERYRRWIDSSGLDRDFFCVDGSAIMTAYGIRDAADLDFLHFGDDDLGTIAPLVNSHNPEAHHHVFAKDDIIFDPSHHFYNTGLKFGSLDVILSMKAKRLEGKDVDDVGLIRSFLDRQPTRFFLIGLRRSIRDTVARARASRLLFPARLAKRITRAAFRTTARAIDRMRPFERTIRYSGFLVHYSRGTSIIERVKQHGTFEGEKTERIIQDLTCCPSPVVMDIGANIGLVSLDILACIEDIRIYAFEPGPHQCALFRSTIRDNDLDGKIELSQFALGATNGDAHFAVHDTRHASGDGFFDTGRAGAADSIEVRVRTTDSWWRDAGCPNIDLVKIDTEGAELMVLRGAQTMIATCRPLLYLEINAVNVQPYPYAPSDILEWLVDHAYTLETIAGKRVDPENLTGILTQTEDYVAVPQPI